MSSDASNSGIMQKADQIAFHFYTKLFYTINQARATEEPHSQGKIDKWFNLETPDSDLFTREAREPYRNISLSPPPGPPPLEIQVLFRIPELTNNQVLIHRSDDSSDTMDSSMQRPSPISGGSPSSAPSQLRIEPTPRAIVLETWTLTFVPHASSNRLSDQALPTIYKHGIPLFRSLYSLLRVLPVWKLYKRIKRRTGGNRNGHLGISLRVKPLEESDEALDILAFGIPPSPSHLPLQTQTHTFSPLPHPLGSLTLSATYLSSPNFELDELESHLSNRFISLDLQGFVPTLSKHAVREEREDGSAGGGGVGPSVGSARSPPRAIVGSTGGRGGHGHSHGLGLLDTGPSSAPGFGESTSSMNSMGRPTNSTKTSDNTTVAERFIIPSPLNLAVTSSSSSALIPPPRPQFTPLPVPLPFPTVGGATSSPSSGASGLALHRMRRESSNSSSSAAAVTGPGTGRVSPEIFSSSISPHRTSSYSHSPHPYPYPSSSLSSSPGAAVPIRRSTAASGISINPFKGNTLSSTASASVSASGSSPSLSIRQGLSSAGVVGSGGGGGSPLSTSFSSRIQQPSSVGSSTRVGFPLPSPSPYGPSTPSSLGDRGGDWDREERERRASNDGSSRERDRFRKISMGGQEDAIGTGGGVGVPTRIPATRKRYSSSFGNRYVGSVGSVGGAGGGGVGSGESDRSTPASVGASTGGVGGLEGGRDGKGKEQNAAGGILSSFLSTTTDDDDISIFVQDIDARKPLSGRVKEGEKRERDREREMERGRDRDREENDQDHDREMRQESGRGKGRVREGGELVTSPVYRPRQRSPLSPLSQREGVISPITGTALPALGTAERMTAESAVPAVSAASGSTTTRTPETTIQSPMLSPSPPGPARLSTSPNRGPMLTNQDDVEEKLKRMNETFMRSLEGMGKGGGSVRRRDKEKGKEKEVEGDRRGLLSLVSPSEGEVPANPGGGSIGGRPLMHTSTSPGQEQEQQHTHHPTRITSPTSSAGSSSNQPGNFYPQATRLALGLELGRGRGGVRSTSSTSTSTSASSEGVGGGASVSQEVVGRMDFYGETEGGPRRF